MFDTPFFASPTTLLLGAVAGLVFGVLLQRGGLARYETIVGQFLLRDHTMLKTMGTAIVVGGIGVYALLQAGMLELHVKSAQLLANLLGGLVFGVGMAVLGYCPGTAVAAAGSGARDAVPGILGMLFGAWLFAEVQPLLRPLYEVGSLGKATLATTTGLSPWWFLGGLAVAAAVGFWWLERRGRTTTTPHDTGTSGAVPRQA